MKKIGLFAVLATSALFASSDTNTELLLGDIFQNNFKCDKNSCVSKDISFNESDTKTLVKDTVLILNDDFTSLKYDKKSIMGNLYLTCDSDKTVITPVDRKKCVDNGLKSKQFSLLIDLLAQSKSIHLNGISLEDKGKKAYVENIDMTYDKNLFKLKNLDFDNVSLNDFIFNLNLKINNLTYDDSLSELTSLLDSMLPASNIEKMRPNGEVVLINKPVIEELNSNIKKMYVKLFDEFNKKNKLNENFELILSSTVIEEDIVLNIKYKSFDDNIGDSIGNTNIKFVKILPLLDVMKKMDIQSTDLGSIMQILQLFGNNIVFENFDFSLNFEKIHSIHTTLLTSDKEYKLAYEDTLNILDTKKIELKTELDSNIIFKIFQYEILSMKSKKGTFYVNNKNKTPLTGLFMLLISGAEFKDLVEVAYHLD